MNDFERAAARRRMFRRLRWWWLHPRLIRGRWRLHRFTHAADPGPLYGRARAALFRTHPGEALPSSWEAS